MKTLANDPSVNEFKATVLSHTSSQSWIFSGRLYLDFVQSMSAFRMNFSIHLLQVRTNNKIAKKT